jgi:hypothetical protein
MKVCAITHREDCVDGAVVKDVHIEGTINRRVIQHLGELGTLQYYPQFPKPFFKLDLGDGAAAKGVEGETSFRVRIIGRQESLIEKLVQHIRTLDAAPAGTLSPTLPGSGPGRLSKPL